MLVVGSTLAPYVAHDPDRAIAWLRNAEAMAKSVEAEVRFFCAIETDARGLSPFKSLVERLDDLGGHFWTFHLDDGATEYTTANRLRRITMGQNLATAHALDHGASHLLFMAADCCPPPDALPKLLDLHWPIVGGEVPTYCLAGPRVERHPTTGQAFGCPVEEHMATAAFVMLERDLMKRLHWRYDTDKGMSDDPCLHADALALGFPTLVRKDVVGRHFPECIGPIEARYSADRRQIVR